MNEIVRKKTQKYDFVDKEHLPMGKISKAT